MQLLEEQRAAAAVEAWAQVNATETARNKAQSILTSTLQLLAEELGTLESGHLFNAPLQEDLKRIGQKVSKGACAVLIASLQQVN
jgi:vacuolar-type H+-ATPase subunit E/Vma4